MSFVRLSWPHVIFYCLRSAVVVDLLKSTLVYCAVVVVAHKWTTYRGDALLQWRNVFVGRSLGRQRFKTHTMLMVGAHYGAFARLCRPKAATYSCVDTLMPELQPLSASVSNWLNLFRLKIFTERLYKTLRIYIIAAIAGIAQLVEQLTCNQ